MGQKTNSVSLRLQYGNRKFDSSWYSDYFYADCFAKEFYLRKYYNKFLKSMKLPEARFFVNFGINNIKVYPFLCIPKQTRVSLARNFGITKNLSKAWLSINENDTYNISSKKARSWRNISNISNLSNSFTTSRNWRLNARINQKLARQYNINSNIKTNQKIIKKKIINILNNQLFFNNYPILNNNNKQNLYTFSNETKLTTNSKNVYNNAFIKLNKLSKKNNSFQFLENITTRLLLKNSFSKLFSKDYSKLLTKPQGTSLNINKSRKNQEIKVLDLKSSGNLNFNIDQINFNQENKQELYKQGLKSLLTHYYNSNNSSNFLKNEINNNLVGLKNIANLSEKLQDQDFKIIRTKLKNQVKFKKRKTNDLTTIPSFNQYSLVNEINTIDTNLNINNLEFSNNLVDLKKNAIFKVLENSKERSYRNNFKYKTHIENYLSSAYNMDLQLFPIVSSQPWQSAGFIADEIVYFLERRVPFSRIKNRLLKQASMQPYIRGLRITCSGRVGGKSKKAQRATQTCVKYGQTSLHVFDCKIDFASKPAFTSFGTVGIKVWICYT